MLKKFSLVIALLVLIFFVGCSGITITTDYDPSADFSKYKTYTWSTVKDSADILAKNNLLLKRVYAVIDKSLQSKGFTKVETAPDIIIYPHAFTKEKARIDTWDYGYSGWWDNYPYDYFGYDIQTNITYYTEGSLIIDIVDANDNQLVWRGVGTGFNDKPTSPRKSMENINKVVTKILKRYPPEEEASKN